MSDPAFPSKALGGIGYTTGMTLRDYFAAKAMQGLLLANHPYTVDGLLTQTKGSSSISELAYIMADAMLKARSE